VKKVVIPVAGLGTRMLPATKAIPKEMLTLIDKPLIQYIVQECASAGFTDIIFVTHASKNAIANHFDTSFELEATLEQRVKRQLLSEIKSITPRGTNIMHIRQGHAFGLGHAIACARPLVADEPFAVVLPDVIIDEYSADLTKDNLAGMRQRYLDEGHHQIMVESVAQDDTDKYGIADTGGLIPKPGGCATIREIVEKPPKGTEPSNLAAVGRYVLGPSIWAALEQTAPGAGGEIQLTDAIDAIIKNETVEAYQMVGESHDCGTKEGYVNAFFSYALRDPKFAELPAIKALTARNA